MAFPPRLGRSLRRTLTLGAVAGAGLTSYAAWEARQYTLRRVSVPVLPPGHAPLKVLHLSDIHMAPDQRAKQEWLRGLADLEPDLVINTGDNLGHSRSVPVVADALGGLLDVPGVYVMGSNDYWVPGMRNPFLYVLPDNGKRHTSGQQLPWPDLKHRFNSAGWLDLTNGFGSLTVGGTSIAFAGVDDPHLKYDGSASRTRPTSGSSTSSPLTAMTRSSPGTRTAGRCACPRSPGQAGRSPPTATSTRPGPEGCTATPPTPRPARRARRGCTCPPGSAPIPTSASESRAAPRRR
jgi:hypothetical protein